MKFSEDHRASSWLGMALCRRYALVHFTSFSLSSLEEGAHRTQKWCWAFAMITAREFEILGAWPMDYAAIEQITDDLRKRGVLSIRAMSFAEVERRASTASLQSRAVALRNAEPRVLEIVGAQLVSGEAVGGVSSSAIRSALNTAGRIHGGLVRGARSRSPFASPAVASDFVASWLQRADQRLYQVRRAPRPVVEHAA